MEGFNGQLTQITLPTLSLNITSQAKVYSSWVSAGAICGFIFKLTSCFSILLSFKIWNEMDKARRVLQLMIEKGCAPNIVTYSTMINGYCKGNLKEALKFFQAMQNSGLELDIGPYTILTDGLCKAGHIEVAKELFHQLSDNGLKPNVYKYGVTINGLYKEELPDEAYRLFGSMGDNDCPPNSCCYTVMIRGFL
ncbi:pentatricopeptide repeat-containing protein At1g63080, mitochondrial isoform X4 [Gossypium hirsutum]|uniref:Pentatricopeptide repeat-containing protein At1g63080, mitochondrial isoform X4 n=1 Tax=Gossypium hirsutum TaxID=3635 RepID=A0ABM3BIG0_GOSHI|nr:pentatricopeptide repeat-containing protein At1g63080, mitochondrial-like isoform X4 [Gossypium hirsutum]